MAVRLWCPGAATIRVALRVLAVLGGLVLLAGAAWLVWKVPPALYAYVPDPKDRAGAESSTRTGLIAGLAGLAALGSLAITARTYRLSLRTYSLSLEGQLTDRYTKAVAQLGDDKLEIRLGGIYALERLAVDSRRDHPTVVEVLSAYVRERTQATTRTRPLGRRTAHPLRLASRLGPLTVDVQAALSVLGRLPARPGVSRADLDGANLSGAQLAGANLTKANLRRANLTKANLWRANLTGAYLDVANLTQAALSEANLTDAWFFGAKLTNANFAEAKLTNANLAGANLAAAISLTQKQLDSASLPGSLRPYGDQAVHDGVLTVLPGGAGWERDGRDTVASRVVDAHFRLRSLDETTSRTEATWTYEFSGVQDNRLLVIFGTHDRRIAAAVMRERVSPLYELWLLNNEDELEDFADGLRSNVEIGITYRDTDQTTHVIAPSAQLGEEVKLGDYRTLIRLPGDLNGEDLRIVQYDLHDLADPDHVVDSVQRVTLRASHNTEDRGFLSWSPSHPCFVRRVVFDMSDLAREGETLAYRLVPSADGSFRLNMEPGWILGVNTLRFELNSWMLVGHAVTLIWRSVDGAELPEPSTAAGRWPAPSSLR